MIHVIDSVLPPEAAVAMPAATPTIAGQPETLPKTGGSGAPWAGILTMFGLVILPLGLSLAMVRRPR